MEDASGTLPRSCASGYSTPRGRGAGPLLPLCGLWPYIRWTWARTVRASKVRAILPGMLAATHRGGMEALPASDAEPLAGVKVSKFAGCDPGVRGTTGTRPD